MTIFSGGILRSNLHRVVYVLLNYCYPLLPFLLLMILLQSPPPGTQSQYERWSLVYFTRPGNSAILRPLSEHSPMIAEAAKKNADKGYETGSTSLEWFSRRIRNQRMKNRTVSFVGLSFWFY